MPRSRKPPPSGTGGMLVVVGDAREFNFSPTAISGWDTRLTEQTEHFLSIIGDSHE